MKRSSWRLGNARWCIGVAAGLVIGSFGVVSAESPAAPAPIIPRDVLFGNPERAGASLSPDGKQMAFLAPVDGVLNVWAGPTDDFAKARPITADKKRGIRQFFWAFDNQHVLYLQDEGGDENWRLYSVEVSSAKAKDLTPFDSIPGPDGKPIMLPSGKAMRPTARVEAVSEKFPTEIMIGLNNRDPQYHDVYRCNIATGQLTKVFENTEWADINIDDTYALRFASKQTKDGGAEIYRFVDGKPTELFEKIVMEDTSTTGLAGFDKTGKVVYFTDARGRDTAALFAMNVETKAKTLLAESPKADAGATMIHPTEKTIQAVAFNHLRNEWTVLDKSIQPDLDYLKSVRAGEVMVSSRTLDDSRWIVNYVSDNGPAYTYLYDRGHGGPGKATFLFANRPKLEGLALSNCTPVIIKSRDGLDLVSYLTLPSWLDADHNARPDAGAIPMVLFVHGGPWARDAWGFNPNAQWLANRGYAVLQVNYRGSTGFGKNFVNAGNKEWAGKMHDDLIDAVNWAVKEKIAQQDKVAIMGGSYGGYATLVGLTFTPDVFACGVDIVGPSSILTLLNTIPPYWQPAIEDFKKRVGDHTTEEGRAFLTSRSPLSKVSQIKKPLLIGQGANDPRVKQSESDQIVSEMQRKNIPVTYVLFPDEGHGFARPENRTAFNAIAEHFLAQHLGGRSEPFGSAIRASTAKVPAGIEGVPGLSNAMAPIDSTK